MPPGTELPQHRPDPRARECIDNVVTITTQLLLPAGQTHARLEKAQKEAGDGSDVGEEAYEVYTMETHASNFSIEYFKFLSYVYFRIKRESKEGIRLGR